MVPQSPQRVPQGTQVSVPFTRGTPPWSGIPAHTLPPCFRFSPLHEGDTSVVYIFFSNRQRLNCVSVPFTRGTPPWLRRPACGPRSVSGFSPLHEGDTSVVTCVLAGCARDISFQSPSRGGHLRGAGGGEGVSVMFRLFQSPSRGGHLRGACQRHEVAGLCAFQSPSRGGHLRGSQRFNGMNSSSAVSVPFTRGTPPWCVWTAMMTRCFNVSVPFTRGTPPWCALRLAKHMCNTCFSPLHEGDTSVVCTFRSSLRRHSGFQSPSRGGHLRGVALRTYSTKR